MKIFASKLLLLLIAFQVSACTSFKTSNGYMRVRDEGVAIPEPGHALFIFERDNARVAEFSALNLWEITGDEPKLVGLLHGTMKAAWNVEPGEHDFIIALAGKTQILRTTVVENKTYFVALDQNQWGTYGPAVYTFRPVRAGEENPMDAKHIGTFNDNAKAWEQSSLTSAKQHKEKAYLQWETYSDEEKAFFTMLPEDGR